MNNYVAITTIINPQRTIDLINKYLLDEEISEVWIYDNGHKEEDAQGLYGFSLMNKKCVYVNTRGKSLAQQWNHAILQAAEKNSNLIISNDDIDIQGNLGRELSLVLRSDDSIAITYPSDKITNNDPVETKGTMADYGMRGDCFMVKPELFVNMLVDERFTYWGLDDDIAKNAEKNGFKQFRVNTCAMQSDMQGTTSTPGFEWMLNARQDDVNLLRDKWGFGR
jgi:hypothetical protein